MSDISNVIVCVWLFPVVFHLILPLAMLAVWLAFGVNRFSFARLQSRRGRVRKIERRENLRVTGKAVDAVVADYTGKTVGMVKDFSRSGICIADFAEEFSSLKKEIFFHADGKYLFSLLIQPKWKRRQQSQTLLGAFILNNPAGWPEFITTVR